MPLRRWPYRSSDKDLFGQADSGRTATNVPEHYLVANIDGGARGNPGPSGYGVSISTNDGLPVAELSEFLGVQTNNYAEYNGLLAALSFAVGHGEGNLRVLSDSELLVKQLKGQYKVSSPALKELFDRAKKMIAQLEWFSVEHVRRERNKEADALANEAMDRKRPGQVVRLGDDIQTANQSANATVQGRPPEGRPAERRSAEAGSQAAQASSVSAPRAASREYRGIVRDGKVELIDRLPDGTRVLVKVVE
jgi:ribonuclease HI